MPGDPGDEPTFVILLRDAGSAGELARYLGGARAGVDGGPARLVIPPVRGLDFFAAERHQAELDRWWAANVPSTASPVYILMHESGLAGWLTGIDGTFYIGFPDSGPPPADQPHLATAHSFPVGGLLDFAIAILNGFSGPPRNVFDPAEALRLRLLGESFGSSVPPSPDHVEPHHERLGVGTAPDASFDLVGTSPVEPPRRRDVRGPDPFELLMEAQVTPPMAGTEEPQHATGNRGVPEVEMSLRRPSRIVWPRRRLFGERPTRELAAAMVGRAPTIVVIGSRKGGVGKTSHAAGVAIVAGEVLDMVGHRAAIVDANIANPDAWGHLDLPVGAATVREVVAALTANREPPPPVHAASPALACYPESREAGDYSRTDVDRLAGHLKRRYSFIVVDMSNRLPDPLAGPEAAAAAYWLEHGDVLVLPTASSKQDFNGVLDYLEVRRRPPTVVPYIVSGDRRNRLHPVTRQYLAEIGRRVQQIVPIPDEADNVRYAGMEGVPVQQVSSSLRVAYRELMEAIVRVPPRDRG